MGNDGNSAASTYDSSVLVRLRSDFHLCTILSYDTRVLTRVLARIVSPATKGGRHVCERVCVTAGEAW